MMARNQTRDKRPNNALPSPTIFTNMTKQQVQEAIQEFRSKGKGPGDGAQQSPPKEEGVTTTTKNGDAQSSLISDPQSIPSITDTEVPVTPRNNGWMWPQWKEWEELTRLSEIKKKIREEEEEEKEEHKKEENIARWIQE